jgi:hypothetical protein
MSSDKTMLETVIQAGASPEMVVCMSKLEPYLFERVTVWPISVAEAARRLKVGTGRVKQMCTKNQLRWQRLETRPLMICPASVTEYQESKSNA